ncbi:extracellular solute-binding protein [Streptomyces sp. AHA2]
MRTTKIIRIAAVAASITVCATSLGACSSSGSEDSDSSYTLWDPYPQFDKNSAWAKQINKCADEVGVDIKRTSHDSQSLTNQALLSAQEGSLPDLVFYDNPGVSTLAATGALATMEEVGIDTSEVDKNLLAPGVVDGKTYGIPVGANTLALYYNKAILKKAGVDPESIKDWASLTDALEAVKKAGHKGITFAGFASEEGTFQFEPFFWGAGADLSKLDSPEAVEALSLWKDWLDRGLAPSSVISNSQTTSWDEFSTGEVGFSVNGTWQAVSSTDLDFETGFTTIPAKDGGVAPSPTGGEFMLMPVKKDTSRYETTKKIVNCISTTEGQVETAVTHSYYIPPTRAAQEDLLKAHPELKVWVEAVRSARGRTSELGTDYPKVSEQVWTAVQNALSGTMTPQEALKNAQKAAESAVSAD